MFVEVFRLLVALLGTAVGLAVGQSLPGHGSHPAYVAAAPVLGCLFGYVLGGIGGRSADRAIDAVDRRSRRLPAAQLIAGGFGGAVGMLAGLVGAVAVASVVPGGPGKLAGGLVMWICADLGFRLFVRRSEELVAMAGLSNRPLVRATPYDRDGGVLVDTSAIMDGQLTTLATAGLLPSELLVPRFVLDELQGLADRSDGGRARKARRGLESLEALRRTGQVRLFILDDEVPEFHSVDAKLGALARRLEIRLITSDHALATAAELQGVVTVNLHRLAAELTPDHTAGERLRIRLDKAGREPDQGVGYLPDGTMVVVNGGGRLVGEEVEAVIANLVPTGRGQIAFAHLAEPSRVG